MYLVTVEHKEDGIWWSDPSGFGTMSEAREFAKDITDVPDGHEVCIYDCRLILDSGL